MNILGKYFVAVFILAASLGFSGVANAIAISFTGTPSPSLSPTFGTLIDFDDQATGTSIGAGDYAAQSLASITETTGSGAAFGRYSGSQSQPNYIGTGVGYELGGNFGTGLNLGWDGIFLFEFASMVDEVGIGVADSRGTDFLEIFDSGMTLLDSVVAPVAANSYVGFDRDGMWDIKYLQVTCDFCALDDLQFTAVPEPGSLALLGLGLLGLYGANRRRMAA